MDLRQIVAAQAAQAAQPQITIGQTINDGQIVALIAGWNDKGTPADSVTYALDVLAETIVQMEGGLAIGRLVQQKKRQRAE